MEAKNLSITKRDYHSLEWKAYSDLQRGAYGAVLDAIAIVDDAVAETDDNRLRRISRLHGGAPRHRGRAV